MEKQSSEQHPIDAIVLEVKRLLDRLQSEHRAHATVVVSLDDGSLIQLDGQKIN